MTTLITASTHFGIAFAADSMISWPPETGRQSEVGQRKLIPWNEMRAVVGFAGRATLQRMPTDLVLERLMAGRAWPNLDVFAREAATHLGRLLQNDTQCGERRIYVHIAGFGPSSQPQMPQFFYLRNADGERSLPDFEVDEDLRETELLPRGIATLDDYHSPSCNFAKVQHSGQRSALQPVLRQHLAREACRFRNLHDVANWAGGKVHVIKRIRPRVVGGEVHIYRVTPEGVEEHVLRGPVRRHD